MEVTVSRGFLLFAQNSKSVNYIKQACALAMTIKISQSKVNSVSIVTNDTVPRKYSKLFDNIIPIPWIDNYDPSRYASEHRWKLFHVSPYEETIVLDSDMLLLEDVTSWWDYCQHYDLTFCSRIKNYKLDLVEDLVHRKPFRANNLSNTYFGLHYFKKTDLALEFYKILEFVCNNWEWSWTKFASVEYQNWLSMDLASAVSLEILGGNQNIIDVCSPLEFIHMKTPLQGWDPVPGSWQDTVPYVYNSKGELVVGNIKQTKLFHYVEKDFLTKDIIASIEELYNGKI